MPLLGHFHHFIADCRRHYYASGSKILICPDDISDICFVMLLLKGGTASSEAPGSGFARNRSWYFDAHIGRTDVVGT